MAASDHDPIPPEPAHATEAEWLSPAEPGAHGPRGEIVGRRVLDRLRTIKIEAGGERRPLRISVGLAAWRESLSASDLLAETRAAARRGFAAEPDTNAIGASPPALGRP